MASFLTSQAISFLISPFCYVINKLSFSQTIIKFQSQKFCNNLKHHSSTMETIIQHLQENTDHENEYYITDDQDDDNDFFEPYDRYGNNSNNTYIVNTILSNIARLNVHLPTTTILVHMIFVPLLTNDGKCTTLDRWLVGGFTAFLAALCVLFSITDSFQTATGELCYGVATFHGIRAFGGGRACMPRVPSDYKLRRDDPFHASFSLIAFLVFVLVQNDVLNCYDLVLSRKFINLAPLVVGFVISLLFVLFPSSRRGIGCPLVLAGHIRY